MAVFARQESGNYVYPVMQSSLTFSPPHKYLSTSDKSLHLSRQVEGLAITARGSTAGTVTHAALGSTFEVQRSIYRVHGNGAHRTAKMATHSGEGSVTLIIQ